MKYTSTIKKNFEFKKLLNKGKWMSAKNIYVYILPNSITTENKIGFVVSRKAGNSVFRNRIRRLCRQAYYDIEEEIKKGYKILIMWKTKNKDCNVKEKNIYDDLMYILRESDLLI